jgi:hypothetical protein
MRFDRYEESSERKRLSGNVQAHGVQTGLSTAGLFLFGLPFVGVGVWAGLAGAKLIPMDESKLNVPHWVLAMFGIVFALAGIMVWSMGWRQCRASRRSGELERRDPALADYPWDTRGFTPPRWSRAAKGIGGMIFLALFLSMFNWWAFFAKGPLMVKIIVGLFDLVLVFVAWQVGMLVGRTVKFGPSRIEFARFPYRPGETVSLHWKVPEGMSRPAKGKFVLRCVEEWYEASGSGKNRKRSLVQEQVWGATAHLDHPQDVLAGKLEELRFDIPSEAAGTSLSHRDARTVFWELAVELDLSGLDFEEKYLVPIYRVA